MTAPMLIPSSEREVSALYRADADVAAMVTDRVYTVLPKQIVFPLIRIELVSEELKWVRPYRMADATIQVSAYADTKWLANRIIETARMVATGWDGTVHVAATGVDGFVSTTGITGLFWNPDDSYSPAKPRYSFDLSVTVQPAGSPGP